MLIDWLLELKDSIDKHGIRMGVIITLFALYRKERRNFRLDQRDADVFHNQLVIMEKLGVADQWKGQATAFQSEEVKNLRKLYSSSQVVIQQVNQLRRKKKMGKITANLSSKKLWAFVLLVILNGLNDTLQLHLSPEAINNITQGGTVYIVIQGVVDAVLAYVKKNGGTPNVPTQPTGDSGAAV